MSDYTETARTQVNRIPKRGSHDRTLIHSIIDQSILCHVGMCADGLPRVIPTAILRVGEDVYLHGSSNSQLLKALAGGSPACITVSIIDALVASRSGFNCAVDYRSVVIFAAGEEVTEAGEKNRILDLFVTHMIPGHKVRPSKPKEVNATTVVRFPLREASAKVRDTGVGDFEEDLGLDLWAGVIPLGTVPGTPRPCPHVPEGSPVPEYATSFSGWGPVEGGR